MLHWSDEYALGIPAMDSDHRILMTLCNDVLKMLENGRTADAVADGLDVLIARTRSHFETEENLLERAGYAHLVGHKGEHERLLREADALAKRLRDPDATGLSDVLSDAAGFLGRWLLEHIRNSDRPYKPFLRNLT